MRTWLGMAILFGAVACMGAEPVEEPELGAAQQAQTQPDAAGVLGVCRALMMRQRECSAEFIPALVNARVLADNPPGIAARDREVGRDALLREAFAEWQVDSRVEAIETLCTKMAAAIPEVRAAELERRAGECLTPPSCDALVACAVPLNVERWTD